MGETLRVSRWKLEVNLFVNESCIIYGVSHELRLPSVYLFCDRDGTSFNLRDE